MDRDLKVAKQVFTKKWKSLSDKRKTLTAKRLAKQAKRQHDRVEKEEKRLEKMQRKQKLLLEKHSQLSRRQKLEQEIKEQKEAIAELESGRNLTRRALRKAYEDIYIPASKKELTAHTKRYLKKKLLGL